MASKQFFYDVAPSAPSIPSYTYTSAFPSASRSTTKSSNGSAIAIGVLSFLVLLAVIGFIVIGTMPSKKVQVTENIISVEPSPHIVNKPNTMPQAIKKAAVTQAMKKAAVPQAVKKAASPDLGGAGISAAPASVVPVAMPPTGTQYQDNVNMQPPVMGMVNAAANAAFRMDQDSLGRATQYKPVGSEGARRQATVPPGGGDDDYRQSMVPVLASTENSGYIPKVIAHAGGPTMAHSFPTAITAGAFSTTMNEDGVLAAVDPETAAQLDKALALSGVPASFGLDADQYERRKAAEIIRTMELTGAADPTLEQVMAASTPFIATQSLLRRATEATGAIDRSIIIETPMRFLYSNPGYRMSTPGITMSPVVTENSAITPGQEYYMLQTGCFDGQCSVGAKQEPY